MAIDDQLGEVLVERGHITREQFDAARERADRRGTLVGTELLVAGVLNTDTLLRVTSEVHQVPIADPTTLHIPSHLVQLIDPSQALEWSFIPIRRSGAMLTIAMAYPGDLFTVESLRYSTGYNVETRVASVFNIRNTIQNAVNTNPAGWLRPYTGPPDKLEPGTIDLSLPHYYGDPLCLLVAYALKHRATDLNLDLSGDHCVATQRVDGYLHPIINLEGYRPPRLIENVIHLARLIEEELHVPQSGTFRCRTEDGLYVRVLTSIMPTALGHRIVLRFQDMDQKPMHSPDLGLGAHQLLSYLRGIRSPR